MNEIDRIFVTAFVVIAVVAMSMWIKTSGSHYKAEIASLKQQLAHAQIQVPIEHDTIRDSIHVADSPVVMATLRQIKQEMMVESELIRDLGLKMKQLEAAQTTSSVIRDTVKAHYDTLKTEYTYHDKWADLKLTVKDTTFYYNIRDSLATFVYREYRKKFLWWQWGTKGYKVKIVNFNPNATVIYNQHIRTDH